jgi:hypothetical protein
MKRMLTWVGGIFLILFILISAIFLYVLVDGKQYDDIAEQHIKMVINNLSNLSMEQFDAYWGPNKPCTPDMRTKMVNSISRLGVLVFVDSIRRDEYKNKIMINGNVAHLYYYSIKAKYTNGPAKIKMLLKGENNKLSTQDIRFYSDVLL